MDRPALELADIFRLDGPAYRERYAESMNSQQKQVMHAIEVCRTAALGGHVDQCDYCGHRRISYNSCGNRHCPKCQSLAKTEWLEKHQAQLLPVPYFHVVFTLPDGIASIAWQNKKADFGPDMLGIGGDTPEGVRGVTFLVNPAALAALILTW